MIGLPLGALIALTRFYAREAVIVVLNALMGLPPVVVGLTVFLALSRSGPLGSFGFLFTPQAMVIAQTVLETRRVQHESSVLSRIFFDVVNHEHRQDSFAYLQLETKLPGNRFED